ncbi:MAG: ABC transporter permease [Opitutus sp.]
MSDVRLALRSLARARGFTTVALLIIALCLGANLTIFAVIDAVLLRALPFPESERLVTIYNTYPKAGVDRDGASATNYYERRGGIAAFSSLAIFRPDSALVGESGSTERTDTARVSPDFFTTVGVPPMMGRSFQEEETTYQTDGVVILTDAYWHQHFEADPAVLNRTLRVDGYERKIVGVLPPTFRFLSSPARLYVPYSSDPASRGPDNRHSGNSITMVGRLKPGASLSEAQSQIDAHNSAVAPSGRDAQMIADAGFRSVVASLHGDHVKSIRPVLLLLQAGVLLLLLIGGVNLTNLLLIRASGRVREFAIRQSMGASRRHVIRAVLIETLLLALGGGITGLLVAAFGIDLVRALGAQQLPLGTEITFDARIAIAALIGSLLFGLLIAAPIVWFNLHTHLANALQSSSRSATVSQSAQTLRHAFIVTQVALAFVLLSGAGLLGVSLRRVMSVSPGFTPAHVLSSALTLPWKGYGETAARISFTENLVNEIAHQPGVMAVGLTSKLPLSGEAGKSAVTVQGHVRAPGETLHGHYSYSVTGDFFTAMSIPLRQGRFLTTADSRRPERSCVVDEDFARRYWPSGDALGQRLFAGSRAGADAEAFTVVGVVGSIKQADLTESDALGAVYFPYGHRPDLQLFVVTRFRQSPESIAPALLQVVHRLDPELALSQVQSMDALISATLVGRRSPALLAAIFSVVALLLAAIGAYGVLSYAVAQRQREIGVRIALGAQPGQIGWQFMSLGLRLLGLGAALGLAGATVSGWAMRSVLFETPALHPGTLVITAFVLSAASLLACYLPARRATQVDPIIALRAD